MNKPQIIRGLSQGGFAESVSTADDAPFTGPFPALAASLKGGDMKNFYLCALCGEEKYGNVNSSAEVIICHICVERLMWTPEIKVYALGDKMTFKGKGKLGNLLKKHFTAETAKHYRRDKYLHTMPQNEAQRAVLA